MIQHGRRQESDKQNPKDVNSHGYHGTETKIVEKYSHSHGHRTNWQDNLNKSRPRFQPMRGPREREYLWKWYQHHWMIIKYWIVASVHVYSKRTRVPVRTILAPLNDLRVLERGFSSALEAIEREFLLKSYQHHRMIIEYPQFACLERLHQQNVSTCKNDISTSDGS